MLPIIEDCFFAAIAAIGFGSINNIPVRAFSGCALLAAAGHGTRTLLTDGFGISIIWASLIGSIVIGLLSIPVSSHRRCMLTAPYMLYYNVQKWYQRKN